MYAYIYIHTYIHTFIHIYMAPQAEGEHLDRRV